jgi:hypothetical protein
LELETQISIAERLQYLTPADSKVLLEASGLLGQMLNALVQSLRTPDKHSKSVA